MQTGDRVETLLGSHHGAQFRRAVPKFAEVVAVDDPWIEIRPIGLQIGQVETFFLLLSEVQKCH